MIELSGLYEYLTKGDFLARNNCVLACSRGYPSHVTKAFVTFFANTNPHLLIYGLTDANPDGVSILASYFYSKTKKYLFSVDVKWMMLRHSQLRDNVDLCDLENNARKSLTKEDTSKFAGLMSHKWTNKKHKEEIELMKASGYKYQINSFLGVKGGFVNHLETQLRKVLCNGPGYEKVAL